jgi:hypothetical protein
MKGMGKYESRLSGTILFPASELSELLIEAANFPHFFAADVFFCFVSLRQRNERSWFLCAKETKGVGFLPQEKEKKESKKRKGRLQRN